MMHRCLKIEGRTNSGCAQGDANEVFSCAGARSISNETLRIQWLMSLLLLQSLAKWGCAKALLMIALLPLSDAEKADAVRRLLAEQATGPVCGR